jgi:vancomycin resistance protein VanJ
VQFSERWLPATLLLYGPRAVVLLPALMLVPIGVLFARRTLLLTVVAVVIATTGIMGFRVGFGPTEIAERTASGGAGPGQLRVVTLNSAGRVTPDRLMGLLARLDPDVMTLQECSAELARWLLARPDWYAAYHHSLCTVSRWPLSRPDSMPRADFAEIRKLGYGGSALAVRYLVAQPGHPFEIVNLHLETARKGLEGLLGSVGLIPDKIGVPQELPFSAGSGRVEVNALIRDRESRRTASWAMRDTASLPVIVSGDFNLPVESTIYRDHWRGYLNAFDRKGRGFGYTKSEGRLLRIRIDHVLVAPHWLAVDGAWIGPEAGSDHRPLVADFSWLTDGPSPPDSLAGPTAGPGETG